MTTNEFIQKLDGLFAAQEYTKVEPFMLSALEEAKEKEDYGLYLSVGNEMIGYYRSISRFQKAYEISEDMLLLMVTQLQNQTIDNQADPNDMMNQIIQMTVMQAITEMKSQVDDLTEANVLSYAASLVGQTVTLPIYDEKGNLVGEKEGVVTGTGLYNGQRVIFVGNETYLLNQIMAVGKLPEKPEVEDPDKPGEGEGVDKPGEGEGVDKPGEGEGVDKPVEGGDETPGTDENGSGTDAAEETVEKALG